MCVFKCGPALFRTVSLLCDQQDSTFIRIPDLQADAGIHQIIAGENLIVSIKGTVSGFVQFSNLIHFSRIQSF